MRSSTPAPAGSDANSSCINDGTNGSSADGRDHARPDCAIKSPTSGENGSGLRARNRTHDGQPLGSGSAAGSGGTRPVPVGSFGSTGIG